MRFKDAQKQFAENAKFFGDPALEPEKYNLYNGLANLASGLNDLQIEMDEMRQQLEELKRIHR